MTCSSVAAPPVWKYGPGQLDVAKAGRLEGAVGAPIRRAREERQAEPVHPGGAGIIRDGADAGAEEAEPARIERLPRSAVVTPAADSSGP